MAKYILVVRKPRANGGGDPVRGFRDWADAFADMFTNYVLEDDVFEVLERNGAGVMTYDKTQLAAIGANIQQYYEVDQTWRP